MTVRYRQYGSQNAASGRQFRAWRYDIMQGDRVIFTNRNTITSRADAEASAARMVARMGQLRDAGTTPFARSLRGT